MSQYTALDVNVYDPNGDTDRWFESLEEAAQFWFVTPGLRLALYGVNARGETDTLRTLLALGDEDRAGVASAADVAKRLAEVGAAAVRSTRSGPRL